MDYDYRQAMREDVAQAIAEKEEWIGKRITEAYDSKEEAYDQLFDDLWIDDSVTGNASGSYYCNAYKAEEAICHNWELLEEAIEELEATSKIHSTMEALDVTIRCYLLPEILAEIIEERWEEANEM